MFELVSQLPTTNTWVLSKKKRLQKLYINVFEGVKQILSSVTTAPSRPHGSQKIAHSCHMQSTIFWPLRKFPWECFSQFKDTKKKIGPGLAPLLIFVGVMGHRWYLCGSGWCISPGVNIKNIWNHLATKRSPFFQKKRPNSFECFCWREAKKGWPQEKRGNFAKMVHSCWGKRVPGKNWNNHDSIRNISSVAIISTFQKAIWKRSHRDFGSSKKVSQKKQQKIPSILPFFHQPFQGCLSLC